jgi:hypothetical protein
MRRCDHGFIIRSDRSRISAKRAYIKDCPEMMCAGFLPRWQAPHEPCANVLAPPRKR